MMSAIKKHITPDSVRRFYMSDLYPILICALTAIGSITGIELYLGIIHTLLMFGALVFSRSVRPFLISLLTYVMQLSVQHSPFYPNYSDYYYTGWRLIAFIAIVAITASGILVFVIKNGIYKKVSFKKSPLLLPILCFSAALLFNGAFSGSWQISDLVFGFANVAVYLVVFLLIYHGFSEDEGSDEIAKYFAYISMLIALVISSELIAHFLTADDIFVDGSINKVAVALGWGIWNLVGVSLSVLIPVIFYGMHVNRYPWLYFGAATLAYIMAVMTMSRNALVFSTLAYGASVLLSCFVGKNKKAFRIITAAGIVGAVMLLVVFWNKISALLGDYFSRGLSDNGRFALWRAAFDNFLSAPIFGKGFYGFEVDDSMLTSFGPLAKQAHNTVLQLLSATGLVGFISYAYYRYESIKPLLRRPSLKKTAMAMSIAVLLFGSLLDNFIFNIYPMFYYSVSLAIIHKSANEEATHSLNIG